MKIDLEGINPHVEIWVFTYDLIIGMDWLESHRAMVYCFAKRVLCVDDEGRYVEIHGVRRRVSLHFISTMKVKRYVRKGFRLCVMEVVDEGTLL